MTLVRLLCCYPFFGNADIKYPLCRRGREKPFRGVVNALSYGIGFVKETLSFPRKFITLDLKLVWYLSSLVSAATAAVLSTYFEEDLSLVVTRSH